MDRALYTLMVGANRSLQAQAVFANNLANISTVGFRGDLVDARKIVIEEAALAEVHKGTGNDISTKSDFTIGQVEQTGQVLDVALASSGFIAVQAADGKEAYTRAGDLQLDSNGLLTTSRGDLVLGNGGPISIPPAEKISIGIDGAISVQILGQSAATLAQIDRIKLVNPDVKSLIKGGDGLFRTENGKRERADPEVTLRSGYVERSNVSAVDMLTKIITTARQFEMQVKTMQTVQENSESSARIMQLS
ncbi:MAG: flagellar basal body rod protein FlgF [Pseudomonadales bacterium]|nr:flagellar basal body rod protein FlgF [Pseudomonadales bacterium]